MSTFKLQCSKKAVSTCYFSKRLHSYLNQLQPKNNIYEITNSGNNERIMDEDDQKGAGQEDDDTQY